MSDSGPEAQKVSSPVPSTKPDGKGASQDDHPEWHYRLHEPSQRTRRVYSKRDEILFTPLSSGTGSLESLSPSPREARPIGPEQGCHPLEIGYLQGGAALAVVQRQMAIISYMKLDAIVQSVDEEIFRLQQRAPCSQGTRRH